MERWVFLDRNDTDIVNQSKLLHAAVFQCSSGLLLPREKRAAHLSTSVFQLTSWPRILYDIIMPGITGTRSSAGV